jgi:hypothetical protein
MASSKLAQERWNYALSDQRAVAARAAQMLMQSLHVKTADLFGPAVRSARSIRESLEVEVARIHGSIRGSAELCWNRIAATMQETFVGSTRTIKIAEQPPAA